MDKTDDIIRKIKKLMAIANDTSASDQEIQLAAYRAEKLMLKYKIDNKDIIESKNKSEKDIQSYTFEKKYTGYLYWTFNIICKHCQCLATYSGKVNSKVYLHIDGFQEDAEIAKAIVFPVLNYMEETLADLKNCYIGSEDFRVFKRDWCRGFADGIENQLKNAFIEMQKEHKFELSVIDLHPVLVSYKNKYIKTTKSNFSDRCIAGYEMGLKDGSNYSLNSNPPVSKKLGNEGEYYGH